MNTYTRDQNKLEAEEAKRYDINADTVLVKDQMILSDVEIRKLELVNQRDALVAYLDSKAKSRHDWHAVRDAASDIEEIEARLDELSRS